MEERLGEEARSYWFSLSSVLSRSFLAGEDGELDADLSPITCAKILTNRPHSTEP